MSETAISTANRSQPTGIMLNSQAHMRAVGRTGTGAAETIPHFLGTTPAFVHAQCRTSSNTVTFAAIPWDNVNIYVTVTNAAIYDLLVMLPGE